MSGTASGAIVWRLLELPARIAGRARVSLHSQIGRARVTVGIACRVIPQRHANDSSLGDSNEPMTMLLHMPSAYSTVAAVHPEKLR